MKVFQSTILLLLCVLHVGCTTGTRCNCLTQNELGAIQDENGFSVNQWLCRQTENAQYNKSMIYRADWIGATDRLSPFGRQRLGTWTKLRGGQPALFVESSGDPYLDSQRQAAISGYLAQSGAGVQPGLIQLVYADDGLEGEEVPAVADRFLSERTNFDSSGIGFSGGSSPAGQPGGIF